MFDLSGCEICLSLTHVDLYFLCFSSLYTPHHFFSFFLWLIIHSLLDVLGGEVQISIADPLNLKPVLEVVVSTAAELHLQTINGLLLKTAAGHVCVLVEADPIPQSHLTLKREKCRKEKVLSLKVVGVSEQFELVLKIMFDCWSNCSPILALSTATYREAGVS